MIQKLIPRLLNMEADETLVRPNEFSDAVNVKVDGDIGVDAGVIKYADGNVVIEFDGTLVSSATERVVGVCEDEATDTIYVFASGLGQDSIYLVEPSGGSYTFKLLVRSNSLDLDPDNFTAANIIRVYEKQIGSVGLDGLTGTTFFDGQQITDFADETIIEDVDDAIEFGSSLFSIIPQLNTPSEIFITQEQLAGAAPLTIPSQFLNVSNQGNATGTITVNYQVVNTNDAYGELETIVLPSNDDNVVAFFAGQQRTITLQVASGAFAAEDGDIINFYVNIVGSDGQVFEYDWSSTVVYVQAVASDPVFTPSDLGHGDLGSVTEGVPISVTKTYSISNPLVPNIGGDVQQVAYEVKVFLSESTTGGDSSPSYQSGDYSYLSSEQDDGTVIIVDGEFTSPLTDTINPGETLEFQLNISVPSTALAGVANWGITVEFIAVGGVLPPSIEILAGSTFVGETQTITIVPELEDPEVLPAVVGFGGNGFASLSGGAILDGVDQQGFFNGSTIAGLSYEFVENNPQFSGTWTLALEPTITLDPTGWFAQHGGSLIKFSNSPIPGSNNTLGTPLSSATWDCNAGSSSVILAQASTNLLGFDAKADLQEFIQDGVAVATYNLRWYVLETNATVLEETFNVSIEGLPDNPSIEVAVVQASTVNSEPQFSSFGSEGIQPVLISTEPYPFVGGGDLGYSVVFRIRNNGDVDLDMPEVRLSNTRMENPDGFSYLASQTSSTYVGNSSFNGDYTNNNVAWTGFGSNIAGSVAGNNGISSGYSDVGGGNNSLTLFGWHPLCYGVMKGSFSDGRDATLYRYYHQENVSGSGSGINTSGGWGSSNAATTGGPRSIAAMRENNPFWTQADDPYTSDPFTFKMFEVNYWNKENQFPATAAAENYSCNLKFPISNFSVFGQSFAVNDVNASNVLAVGEEIKVVFYPYGDGGSNLTAFVEVIPPSGSKQLIENRKYRYKLQSTLVGTSPPPSGRYTSGENSSDGGQVVEAETTQDPVTPQPERINTSKTINPKRVTISDKSTPNAIKKAKFKKYK